MMKPRYAWGLSAAMLALLVALPALAQTAAPAAAPAIAAAAAAAPARRSWIAAIPRGCWPALPWFY